MFQGEEGILLSPCFIKYSIVDFVVELSKMTEKNFEPSHDLSQPVIIAEEENFEIECLRPFGIPEPTIRYVQLFVSRTNDPFYVEFVSTL